jgi:hypothetical protein
MSNGLFGRLEPFRPAIAICAASIVGMHCGGAAYISVASLRCDLIECPQPDNPPEAALANLSTGTVGSTGVAAQAQIINAITDVPHPIAGAAAGDVQTLIGDYRGTPPGALQIITWRSGDPPYEPPWKSS